MAKTHYKKQLALAQNFLRDSRTVRSLLEVSGIGLSDTVYEIGPGRGIITAELARTASKVIAIEEDPALVCSLRARFEDAPNVEIVAGDFLDYRLADGAFKVVGNIPFNRTADLMRKILFGWPVPLEAYLVMQKEAAEKFSGCGKETQFSVLAKPRFELEIIRKMRRTDFVPVPKVESVLLRVRKRPSALIAEEDMVLYQKFVRYGFWGWKKNLKLTFKPIFTYKQWKRLSRTLGFSMNVRPSALTFEQWLGLFDCFKWRVSGSKQMVVNRF